MRELYLCQSGASEIRAASWVLLSLVDFVALISRAMH